MDTLKDNSTEKWSEVLEESRQNISQWYGAFSHNYFNGREDERFLNHQQWSPRDILDLDRLGMPVLTVNKLYDYTKKVKAEMRKIRPEIMVRSLDFVEESNDEKSTKQLQKIIDLRQNLIRTISYRSESQQAYQHAYSMAVNRGYGCFRIDTEYDSSNSINVSPCIKKILMPETAFFDPMAEMCHKGDGDFCGIYEYITKKEFERRYPGFEYPTSFPLPQGESFFQWSYKDMIAIVHYYRKERFRKTIYLLDDGRMLTEDEYKLKCLQNKKMGISEPIVIDKREKDDFNIIYYCINYNEVMVEKKFPGKCLPIIFVDNDSYHLDGRQYTQSFIKHAKDSQRALNYLKVAIMQYIKNARKEQFIATEEQLSGFEEMWVNPENASSVLLYNSVPNAPPPQKVPPSEVPQSLYNHFQRIGLDIQSTLGYYDANLGAPKELMSGKAINAEVRQGNLATFLMQDNLISAIEQGGRCILSMIPELYDTERTVMMTSADGKQKNVRVNKMVNGSVVENDLMKGNFEVAIDVGSSYEMQREQALESLRDMINTLGPQAGAIVADLYAANINVENRQQLVERFRKTLVPPPVIADEQGEKLPPPAPPPPTISESIQMGNLQFKNNQLQSKNKQDMVDAMLKQNDQALEAMRLQNDKGAVLSKEQETRLKSISEMYKANAEVKSSHHNLLAKLLDQKHSV